MKLDRHQEWRQIFDECWRQERDFFYDPNMHGVDWKGVHDKYAPLVKYVNHRADLTYIIGEMIGELNCGHCYVGGGDYPHPPRIETGLLGAELKRDPAEKAIAIVKILKGDPGDPKLRSPLTDIGVDAKEGDYHHRGGRQADGRHGQHLRGAGRQGRQAGDAASSTPALRT